MDNATKRPWHLKHNGIMNHSNPTSFDIEAQDNIFIGHIYPIKNHTNPKECEANARLIVKAVNCHDELIEALKYALDFINTDSPKFDKIHTRTKIKQALSKAEQQ